MEYRLLKWYPSLPSDWAEKMKVGQGDRGISGDFSPCHGKFKDKSLPFDEVTTNNTFWQKLDKPLFTTEDGVDIYYGDIYYVPQVAKEGLLLGNYLEFTGDYTCEGKGLFSSKENAEKYIKSKKQYSIVDIRQAVNNWSMTYISNRDIINFLGK